jgi:hypothetical protein
MDTSKESKDIKPTQKLDGIKNYTSWAALMRAILHKKKCWAAIEKTTTTLTLLPKLNIPEGAIGQARMAATTAKQEQEAANKDIQEKFDTILEQRDDAIYYIMMKVQKHSVHHISAMTDPYVLWK